MDAGKFPGYPTPWMYDDPGHDVGPKTCDLWKPVIAAVHGMACGGAFYMLGEVEFIIASDDATFFDPHVTYGMTAAFEPIQMLAKMPFQEIMRMSLLGADERMSAERAREIGLVTEVVPRDELREPAGVGGPGHRRLPAARRSRARCGRCGPRSRCRAPRGSSVANLFTRIGSDRRGVPGGSGALRLGPAPEVAAALSVAAPLPRDPWPGQDPRARYGRPAVPRSLLVIARRRGGCPSRDGRSACPSSQRKKSATAGTRASAHCGNESSTVPKILRRTSIWVMSTARTNSARAVQFRCRLSKVSVVNVVAVTLRAWKAAVMRSSENAVTPIEVPTATLS